MIHFTPSGRRFRQLCLLTVLLAGPPSAFAAHDGAKLYRENCAACHGLTGSGGVGVPLRLPDFLAIVDDAYLAKTIRRGRPGRVMPAFNQLSDAEIQSIIKYLRQGVDAPRVKPVKVGKGDAKRGSELYDAYCSGCHGDHGQGGHGTGVTFSRPRDLPILPPALNNPGFLSAASDELVKSTLFYGRRGTPMESFAKRGLTDQKLDDLVAYVRGFASQPAPPSAKVLESESAILVRESPLGLDETVERVRNAVSAVNMRIIRVVPFEQGLAPKGNESHKSFIVDGCDFDFLNKALSVDPRVGLFLPCRITIAEHDGKVRVMTVNPKRLSAIFNNAELNDLCSQMHKIYTTILEEATF